MCDQCSSGFAVCTKCINLMKTEHVPLHSFKMGTYSIREEMLIHYNIICDGCKARNFKGLYRYQCHECRESYDLCASCYQNAHKLHPNHKFKIVQSPLLQMSNSILMANRAIQVLKRFPNQQRDPLTGYTMKVAERIKEQEEKNFNVFWEQRQQEERNMNAIQNQRLQEERSMNPPQEQHLQEEESMNAFWEAYWQRRLQGQVVGMMRKMANDNLLDSIYHFNNSFDRLRAAASPF